MCKDVTIVQPQSNVRSTVSLREIASGVKTKYTLLYQKAASCDMSEDALARMVRVADDNFSNSCCPATTSDNCYLTAIKHLASIDNS